MINKKTRVFVLILFLFSLSLISVFMWSNFSLDTSVLTHNDNDSNNTGIGDAMEARMWIYGEEVTDGKILIIREIFASVIKDENFISYLSIYDGPIMEYYVSDGYIQIYVDATKRNEFTTKDAEQISKIIKKHARKSDYPDVPIVITEMSYSYLTV